jgi:hypothetical protein
MTSEEMERLFDEGDERYLEYFDLDTVGRLNPEQRKVSITLPDWMIGSLDREAKRLGITRQAVISTWIDEKLHNLSA